MLRLTPLVLALAFSLSVATARAIHDEGTKAASPATDNPFTFAAVLSQALTDPELKDFKVETTLMTIAPGGVDAVAHRHDGELFGYVLKGRVEIGLEGNPPDAYAAGQMFFEKRNVLHSLARNPSNDEPVEVLLIMIIKNGRSGYTPESTPAAKP